MDVIMRQNIGTIRLSLEGSMARSLGDGSLRRQVSRALSAGADLVIVDASGLGYLDAAGLGELVACRALARQDGARFRLRGVFGKALQVLRMTGLEGLLVAGDGSNGTLPGMGLHVA